MQNICLTLAAAAILAAPLHAQKSKNTIEGNGHLVTKDVPVKSFEKLSASGVYELNLAQGNTETVKIEADENLQDLFIVHNDGNSLVIEMKKNKNLNLKSKNKMKVYVTFKKLKSLELNMVGNVKGSGMMNFDELQLKNNSVGNVSLQITANSLDVSNNSVGNVKLSGKVKEAFVKNSGVGSLEAGNLAVQNLDIENSGVGNAEVNAEKELKVKDSFLGKVKNRGKASVKKMNKVVS
ncbi:MAG TPA: head GIN domain-containing protein [Chitinophagaceae bacterium]